jgi:hypothetical protein
MAQPRDKGTAMAKALVDGLEGKGIGQLWAKLNQRNAPGYRTEKAMDSWVFYVEPERLR